MSTVVFLGGGRITSALLRGLCVAKFRAHFVVHDRNAHKLRTLKKQFGVTVEPDLAAAIAAADLLILAVRPQDVPRALNLLPSPKKPLPALSLAAGVTLEQLQARSPAKLRWARAMPSPACRTGHGLTALTLPRSFPPSARKLVQQVFAAVGETVSVPDQQMDAFTVLFSPSHGQHALHTLTEVGVRLGLSRYAAERGAFHALAEGLLSWRTTGASLRDALEEAATPGGTAAAVMAAMDESGYAEIVERALRAGARRAKEVSAR